MVRIRRIWRSVLLPMAITVQVQILHIEAEAECLLVQMQAPLPLENYHWQLEMKAQPISIIQSHIPYHPIHLLLEHLEKSVDRVDFPLMERFMSLEVN